MVKFSIPLIFPKDSGEVSQIASHVPSSLSSSLHENNENIINDKGIIFFIRDSFYYVEDIKNGSDETKFKIILFIESLFSALIYKIPSEEYKSGEINTIVKGLLGGLFYPE